MSPTMSDESQSFFGDVLQWQMQDSSDHFKRIAVESVEKQILSFHVIFALSLSCYH